jgi:hypothetical protein
MTIIIMASVKGKVTEEGEDHIRDGIANSDLKFGARKQSQSKKCR